MARTIDDLRRGMPPVETHGETHAIVVWHAGSEVLAWFGSNNDTPCGPGVTHISWSMAKSITHALVGLFVGDGLLDIDAPAAVPEWKDDARSRITLRHLLEMRSGLEWTEDYVDGDRSNVIEMLFGAGKADHAAYAAAQQLVHEPGTHWLYSSGTTNIICRILGDLLGGESANDRRSRMSRFISRRLFEPLGMSSATAKFDQAGNFVGSSFVFATATDFARFGNLYLHDEGTRVGMPKNWIAGVRTPVSADPESGSGYSLHWWNWSQLPASVSAVGYAGQYTIVLPADDLVVVRLGNTPEELRPNVVNHLVALVGDLRR